MGNEAAMRDVQQEGVIGDETSMQIAKESYLVAIQDPEVQRLMDLLGVPPNRAEFFEIFDADGSGSLTQLEIIQGLLKIRGQTQRSDVVGIWLLVRAMQETLSQ